jgi:F-type H+-transporting ATPase subunit delta
VKNILLARRYSLAIYKSIERDKHDSILKDISALRVVFAQYKDLIKNTDSYLVAIEKRIAVAQTIADTLTNKEIWKNLFDILIKRHKFSVIPLIIDDLEHLVLDSANKAKVLLKVAHKQSDETITKIKSKISDIIEKDVILDIVTDPQIIGGFIAETESLQIDGSVKNNLEKFKLSIIK